MSVATEFPPVVEIPARARRHAPQRPPASVTVLHAPSERSVAAPLRLTSRGVVVLGVAVATVAVGLVAAAWLSVPHGAGAVAPTAPARVTVRAGDTLWAIAGRVAPQRDPRAEIADLTRWNRLRGAALVPGQVLRTR